MRAYALDPESEARWFADVGELEAALETFGPRGDVLELAAGTGLWTQQLLRFTDRVTAVDAVAEVLELNRARTGGAAEYLLADLFAWQPEGRVFLVDNGETTSRRTRAPARGSSAAVRPTGARAWPCPHHRGYPGARLPRCASRGPRFLEGASDVHLGAEDSAIVINAANLACGRRPTLRSGEVRVDSVSE